MSFNVYVTSAKTFMEEFYRQLQKGQALGVAPLSRENTFRSIRHAFIRTSQTLTIGRCP